MGKRARPITLKEALAERDAASRTCMFLIEECKLLRERIRRFNHVAADNEFCASEQRVKNIIKGKRP